MIREGKHYCDKEDCGIELPWAPGSFHKFNFEYQVTPNRRGLIFCLELCTECEEELTRIVSSLMNKYLVLPETKYPTTMRA